MLPVARLEHQRHDGRAAAAEQHRVDRHALRVLPLGRDRRALRRRRGEAGVRVRGRVRRTPGVQSLPCQSIACAGGSPVSPSHQTSPSSVVAQLVKIELRSSVSIAFGLVSAPVPGATPKKPASGLTAYSRPSSPNFIQAMSSPIVSTFQSGSVGISIARLVLPHALGNAPVMYFDLALGRGELEDQHVLGQPALVAGHHRGDPQREALLAEQRVAAVARAEGPDLAGLGEVDDVLVVGVARPRHVLRAVGQRGMPTECRQGTNSPSSPSTSSAGWPMRVMIRIEHAT